MGTTNRRLSQGGEKRLYLRREALGGVVHEEMASSLDRDQPRVAELKLKSLRCRERHLVVGGAVELKNLRSHGRNGRR